MSMTDVSDVAVDTSKMKVSDEKVRLDSIGPGDTISTYPTTHFRMTLGFNMDVEAMMARSRFGSEAVTDYWVASIPGMMSNPLLRSNGLAGSHGVPGMLRELSLRVDSASQRMGRTVVLRSSSVTRVLTRIALRGSSAWPASCAGRHAPRRRRRAWSSPACCGR